MNEPYDFIASFSQEHALDAAEELNHWLLHGYVFKSPDYFLIGGEDRDDPKDDVWFVYWAEVAPYLKNTRGVDRMFAVATFLKLMPYHRPYVKFYRGLKNDCRKRIYSTDRLLRLIS